VTIGLSCFNFLYTVYLNYIIFIFFLRIEQFPFLAIQNFEIQLSLLFNFESS
jgi:hypothetical protein